MMLHRKLISLSLLSAIILFSACKKNSIDEDAAATSPSNNSFTPAPATATMAQLNLVSYTQAQDWYLWSENLPATLDLSAKADPNAVMTAIRPYSTEAGFSSGVDRWSFAMKQSEWNAMSGGMANGFSSTTATGDFGLTVFFRAEGDLRVRMSEPNSAAGQAGVQRGWRITKINGNANITTSNSQSIINSVYYSPATSFTFQKPNGSFADINLNASSYAKKPVLMDTVYHTPGGTTGYLVYTTFLGDMNQSRAEYARVFNKFAAAGVTNLIVDLRYNGGGYVDLQTSLANYIVTPAATGQLMMKQMYNSRHAAENESAYFVKAGALNPSKVYFIVSSSTASASELLINNLRPYMDVRLIGPSKTHGKPVGYFPIANGDWYTFPVSFKTVNKNGEGNYYNGFSTNATVADGLDKNWGDVTESCLASALRNISSGSYRGASDPVYVPSIAADNANKKLDEPFLKLTVDRKN